MTSETSNAPPLQRWLARYRPWQSTTEAGLWTLFFCGQAVLNSITTWLEIRRLQLGFTAWEPVVWEWSSNLMLLALVPGVIAFERRYPLTWARWRASWHWHLIASIAFSTLHVIGMVALRKLAYASQNSHYDFGHRPVEFFTNTSKMPEVT